MCDLQFKRIASLDKTILFQFYDTDFMEWISWSLKTIFLFSQHNFATLCILQWILFVYQYCRRLPHTSPKEACVITQLMSAAGSRSVPMSCFLAQISVLDSIRYATHYIK
jgi:hypothetical protein